MDFLLGMIKLFPYNYSFEGWLPCDGRTLNISQYPALHSLIGYNYGGDGRTTFCLPNLTGLGPEPTDPKLCYYIAIEGFYPERP